MHVNLRHKTRHWAAFQEHWCGRNLVPWWMCWTDTGGPWLEMCDVHRELGSSCGRSGCPLSVADASPLWGEGRVCSLSLPGHSVTDGQRPVSTPYSTWGDAKELLTSPPAANDPCRASTNHTCLWAAISPSVSPCKVYVAGRTPAGHLGIDTEEKEFPASRAWGSEEGGETGGSWALWQGQTAWWCPRVTTPRGKSSKTRARGGAGVISGGGQRRCPRRKSQLRPDTRELWMWTQRWCLWPEPKASHYSTNCVHCMGSSDNLAKWKSLSHVRLFATPRPVQSMESPGQNTRVRSLSLLQGIIPTQESNSALLHCRQILYQLSHKGSPRILEWVTYPFSSRSSWLRNRTGVSCIAGRFFTNWAIREAPKNLKGIKIKSRMSFPS